MAVEIDGVDASIPSHARNVLLEAPVTATRSSNVCVDLVANQEPAVTRVLTISYRDRASDIVDHWLEHVGHLPGELVVVEAREQGSDPEDLPDSVTVLSESPGDLTWLSVHTSEYLTRWSERGENVAICIDSLTSMLQYAELEKLYRFLHIFSGRVETAEARAHHHIDPQAHERQELNTVKQLCDAVLTYDSETDGWTIRTR